MKRTNFPKRREQRKVEAEERQAKHGALPLEQKLKKLDTTPGESRKERKKLSGLKVNKQGQAEVVDKGQVIGKQG